MSHAIWSSPTVERRWKFAEFSRTLNEAYKWIFIDVLLSFCVLLEYFPAGLENLYNRAGDGDLGARLNSPLSGSLVGPSMFCSHLLNNTFDGCSRGATYGTSLTVSDSSPLKSAMSFSDSNLPLILDDSQTGWQFSPCSQSPLSSQSYLVAASSSPRHSESSPNRSRHSLLDLALSPISNIASNFTLASPFTGGNIQPLTHNLRNNLRSHTWSSPLWTSLPSPRYQYQAACISSTNPTQNYMNDQQRPVQEISFTSVNSNIESGQTDLRPCLSGSRDQFERTADEYWTEYQISVNMIDKWTMNLRRWLHGTIIRRIVNELDVLNRHLTEASGGEAIIGSTTLTTLQQLCSTKYQYLPTLPTLITFLDFTKDQGYLVNRLKELARESCLQEFHWDSGSRSDLWPWKEHLPSDSLILLHLFTTYMDTRMPPHPKCLTGRVFSQLHVVRHPDKPDLKSKYNCQFYQVSVQPPHFKLVLNGRIYTFPMGPKNLYHAMLLFFHHYVTVDGKFRSVALGPSGLNVAWIFSKN